MFSQILTAFQAFFTRDFWLGSFLPVALVATLHLVILETAFPEKVALGTWLGETLVDQVTVFSAVIAALVAVAYMLTPFTHLILGVLDGQLLPDWLHNLLREDRRRGWLGANERLTRAAEDYNTLDLMHKEGIERLSTAQQQAGQGVERTDEQLIQGGLEAVNALAREMGSAGMLPRAPTARDAVDKLVAALEANAPTPEKLDNAQSRLSDLLEMARAEAFHRYSRMASRSEGALLATRVGDARRRAETYCLDTYGVEFDYVWTRVQMILPEEDSGFFQRVSDAQSQVKFSVLTLTLAVTIPLTWLPILVYTRADPTLFLWIGLLSPVVIWFLYELVVQSQRVFGDVVASVIDKYRRQVLTDVLHQSAPETLVKERELWAALRLAGEPANRQDFVFAIK